jgi:hypothetical protein
MRAKRINRGPCQAPGCHVKAARYKRNERWTCAKHMDRVTYRRIDLTPAEVELWDWAVDPMVEFWAEAEDRHHDGCRDYSPYAHARWEAIQPAEGCVGLISDDPDVADDLIYRVETQMSQMAIEEGGYDERGRADAARMAALRSIATGRRLADKVRQAIQGEAESQRQAACLD